MALISRNAKPKPSSWRKAGPRGAGQEWQRFNHAAGSEALPFARATEVVGRFVVSVKRKTQTVVLAQGRTSRCEPRMAMGQSRGYLRGPAVRQGDGGFGALCCIGETQNPNRRPGARQGLAVRAEDGNGSITRSATRPCRLPGRRDAGIDGRKSKPCRENPNPRDTISPPPPIPVKLPE